MSNGRDRFPGGTEVFSDFFKKYVSIVPKTTLCCGGKANTLYGVVLALGAHPSYSYEANVKARNLAKMIARKQQYSVTRLTKCPSGCATKQNTVLEAIPTPQIVFSSKNCGAVKSVAVAFWKSTFRCSGRIVERRPPKRRKPSRRPTRRVTRRKPTRRRRSGRGR